MFKSLLKNVWQKANIAIKNPLVRNIFIVGTVSLIGSLVSFYKETLVASYFGLSELMDTYLIAVLIPSIIQHIFIGALKNLFIPNYVIELKTSRQNGSFQTFIFLTITALIVLLVLLAIFFVFFFLELVFPGHDGEFYNLIRIQFYIALPCLFLWGYTGFLAGLLELENKFLVSTLSKFITPIIIIIGILFFKNIVGDMVLVWSLTIGSLLTFIYYLIMNLRYKTIVFKRLAINKNMLMMIKQYPPKVTSGLLTGINPFVDQFFAAQLVIGSVTAISFGIKIPAFIVSILILALSNVLLPHFSRTINDDLINAYRQLFKILKITFLVSAVITFLTFIVSNDIIRLFFERNEFTASDTTIVSNIQRIALLYVPFYLCTLVCVNFLTATNKNSFMAWVSLWNLILNLLLNFILMKYYDVYGLVLSTTIVYIICSFIYVGFTYKQYKVTFNPKSTTPSH